MKYILFIAMFLPLMAFSKTNSVENQALATDVVQDNNDENNNDEINLAGDDTDSFYGYGYGSYPYYSYYGSYPYSYSYYPYSYSYYPYSYLNYSYPAVYGQAYGQGMGFGVRGMHHRDGIKGGHGPAMMGGEKNGPAMKGAPAGMEDAGKMEPSQGKPDGAGPDKGDASNDNGKGQAGNDNEGQDQDAVGENQGQEEGQAAAGNMGKDQAGPQAKGPAESDK